MTVQARVLAPPVLKYGPGSRELTIVSIALVVGEDSSLTFSFCLETCKWAVEHVSPLDNIVLS